MKITIEQAKEIRELLNMTHLVIFAVDRNGMQHVATHGESTANAKEAADMGSSLKESLEWPPSQNTPAASASVGRESWG